jgi:HSP20 family protein
MVTVTPLNSVLDRMATLSRAMDHAFSPTGNPQVNAHSWTPPVDAAETEQAYVISLDLPGVTPDKVDVNFEANTLTVRGERAPSGATTENARVLFAEREWGNFERALRFPQHVEGDKISATFANGVLTVTVPKSESAKARKIEVK